MALMNDKKEMEEDGRHEIEFSNNDDQLGISRVNINFDEDDDDDDNK